LTTEQLLAAPAFGLASGFGPRFGQRFGVWFGDRVAGGGRHPPVCLRDCRIAMTDRPEELELVKRYFRAARYAHEYAGDTHLLLGELGATDEETRRLLGESAAIVLQEMPRLARDWRTLEHEWSEQQLLDPPKAERTAHTLAVRFTKLGPALKALRVRQDEIVAELDELLNRARRT